MESIILSNKPRRNVKIASVTDAVDFLQAWDTLYELDPNTSTYNACGDSAKAEWFRANVRREVLNCGGKQTDFDIFEKIAGGQDGIKPIPTKAYTIMSQCGIDWNFYAQGPQTGSAPGAAITFQLNKDAHSGDGKYSKLAEGNDIYIYEDMQELTVTDIDKDNDYGHLVTAVPKNVLYTANIRANSKMLIIPARNEGAISCAIPDTNLFTPGYENTIRPFKNRADWELPIDLMKGYEGIMQFALILDANGVEQECWLPKVKQDARWKMRVRKNLEFFIGQSIDNPAHPLFSKLGGSGGYTGFEGYLPTMYYGGGNVVDFDPATGFDLQVDYEAIVQRNDALKRNSEYMVLTGRNFMVGLTNANNTYLKNSGLTFETFKRSGADQAAIQKLGITSYSYMGNTLHFKLVDGLTDSRFVGNGDISQLAMFMPGDGITNSDGESVPTIEMYMPYGCGQNIGYSGYLEEWQVDHRKNTKEKCEIISGSIQETVMMGINCPSLHILANPVRSCAA